MKHYKLCYQSGLSLFDIGWKFYLYSTNNLSYKWFTTKKSISSTTAVGHFVTCGWKCIDKQAITFVLVQDLNQDSLHISGCREIWSDRLLELIWQINFWVLNQQNDRTRGQAKIQGFYSLSRWMSYRKISWSLEAARLEFRLFPTLLNLTCTLAAMLSGCLSHFRMIGTLKHPILRLRDFMRFDSKTSYCLVNRGHSHGIHWNYWGLIYLT